MPPSLLVHVPSDRAHLTFTGRACDESEEIGRRSAAMLNARHYLQMAQHDPNTIFRLPGAVDLLPTALDAACCLTNLRLAAQSTIRPPKNKKKTIHKHYTILKLSRSQGQNLRRLSSVLAMETNATEELACSKWNNISINSHFFTE